MTTLALGLVGIVPGVAGLANITLLLSLGFLAAKALALGDPPQHDRKIRRRPTVVGGVAPPDHGEGTRVL